ncbi:FxsB family cyclophane-forming radical SAM/SPASM peptide maturase [Actinoplanes sp. L3-i22]|uniref:FxsB family cyclophane-forming radical SAM/SPASM peptide maturase n=1 Tax=Actinoplanes sp. L3-i22 TaxID=2836373 RepID=UPI001C78B048|nr:FxsB family cyclophane-forming radical SAM/SPASM peptide maturase [Actinoplanes sp. L3-i22]BCY08602.1 hypothetical protein L3i22_036900 [Actinoplanes sp. L3-i22]
MRAADGTLGQFVLKVASRCDLGCDYCYVYRMADRSYARQPRFMSRATLGRTAERIAEHAAAHRLRRVRMVFHGGEPMLAGPAYLAEAARTLRAALPPGVEAELSVQTHGGLLDEPFLEVLDEHRIRVGVSLDGDARHHDRHRLLRTGQGSYEQTARGLRLLTSERFRHLFAGLLCVVDLANDPIEVYRALLAFRPPVVDFLLPHANWTRPPPGLAGAGPAPYGKWLCKVFDRWYDAPAPETTVRLFSDLIRGYTGRPARSEQIGLSPPGFAVIDTDGALQQVDTLKSVRPGAADTGLHVATHSMDEVAGHPDVRARGRGLAGLCATCRSCPLVRICGGGAYVHRFGPAGDFGNPSVYCHDMAALIRHAVRRLAADLGPAA